MERGTAAPFVLAFCLFVCSLSAQEATVIHGVSRRGDPFAKTPPSGHFNKNSTVTPRGKTEGRLLSRQDL